MSIRKSLKSVVIGLSMTALLASSVNGAPPIGERPNVIIILSDDQGWADIGYNNPKVYTPNLDKLANAGAKLTNHYVMPQCTPTRVALMTGRYPGRVGRDNKVHVGGRGNGNHVKPGLVEGPRHVDILSAVVGGAGAGDQKNQRRRTFLQCLGVAQFCIVPEGLGDLVILENSDAALFQRDLFR